LEVFQAVRQKGHFFFGVIYLGHFKEQVLPVKAGDKLARGAEP
jgi:hypothetical protein